MTIRKRAARRPFLGIGTVVEMDRSRHRVEAVGVLKGERYYWLVEQGRGRPGLVSMLPADSVEDLPVVGKEEV